MGQQITKLIGWSAVSKGKASTADSEDQLIDELCGNIVSEQTANALKIIKSVPDVNKLSRRFHLSPLHIAVETGNLKCIEMLLQHSADVNIKDCRLFSPLHIAAGASRVKASCVQPLLNAGAEVTAKDIWGKTPLHRAAICSHYDVLHILLETGCDVNVRDGLDRSCLMYLTHCPPSDDRMVEMVLRYGADVNSKDKKGRSPLYFAVLSRRLPLLVLLVQHGADVKDRAPMKLAISRCYEDCVHTLLGHGAALSLDMMQTALNKFKCGHRIDQPTLEALKKCTSLIKLLVCAFGERLAPDHVRGMIMELLYFINTLKNQTSICQAVLLEELSQIVPVICLIVSVNSVPLRMVKPLLSMFEEYCLVQRVERELGYRDVPPLTHCCRSRIRQELSRNGRNLLFTVSGLTALPSAMKNFITAQEYMD